VGTIFCPIRLFNGTLIEVLEILRGGPVLLVAMNVVVDVVKDIEVSIIIIIFITVVVINFARAVTAIVDVTDEGRSNIDTHNIKEEDGRWKDDDGTISRTGCCNVTTTTTKCTTTTTTTTLRIPKTILVLIYYYAKCNGTVVLMYSPQLYILHLQPLHIQHMMKVFVVVYCTRSIVDTPSPGPDFFPLNKKRRTKHITSLVLNEDQHRHATQQHLFDIVGKQNLSPDAGRRERDVYQCFLMPFVVLHFCIINLKKAPCVSSPIQKKTTLK
jgi:hypothetical protein